MVNHPSHYNQFGEGIEVIDVTELMPSPNLSNVIKYISRAKFKNNEIQDLNKALWYLRREMSLRSRGVLPDKSRAKFITELKIPYTRISENLDNEIRDVFNMLIVNPCDDSTLAACESTLIQYLKNKEFEQGA